MFLKIISRAVGAFARIPFPSPIILAIINTYIFVFRINRAEILADLKSYKNLDEFFIRALKPEARPLDTQDVLIPADGKLILQGVFEEQTEVEIKGLQYHLSQLFGGHSSHEYFKKGTYSVIYLSPSDYHCVHSPIAGTIERSIHIAGYLRTVAPGMSLSLDKTFIENERVISILKTDNQTRIAVIMVGAVNVGSIEMCYLSRQQQPKYNIFQHRGIQSDKAPIEDSTDEPKRFDKGQLLGKFHMGSTVIVCTEADKIQLLPIELGAKVKFGKAMGALVK
jgi:phosphatidylserine decarboxylase